MRLSILAWFGAVLTAGGLLACGGGTTEQTDGGDDAGADVVTDDVMDASVAYPADHTPLPLVDYNGGRIIANPKVVTITFSNDDANMVTRLQQFGDTITSTQWWSTITSEYCQQPGNKPCIGPGTSGGHVVIADPPAPSYTDSSQGGASSIQDFIKQHVMGAAAGDAGASDAAAGDAAAGDAGEGGTVAPDFPVPDDNTLYAIYFPAGVSIDLDGSGSCNTFGAYHNTVMLPNASNQQIPVAYAIIPRCDTKEATTTLSASHEIAEAATDPDIGVGQVGYYMLNQLWAFAGGEVGDLCVGFMGNDTYLESTFTVQRSWSNLSAKASHNPCVPIPSGDVYFNSAPRTQHIVLPKLGATAVVDIDAFSDGPTADWTLSAVDYAAFQGQTPQLSFSFDTTTANNGTHVQLTVTETVAISGGQDAFVILSTQGQTRHTWPVLVTTK